MAFLDHMAGVRSARRRAVVGGTVQDRTSGKYRINASDKNRMKDHDSPAYYRRAMRKFGNWSFV